MRQNVEGVIRTFAMRDGAELHYRHWETPRPRGAVVAIHGIQSHSGWYEASCAHLSSAGYDVSFLDRRGSGLNKASRGDLTDWRVLADDLREFTRDARRRLGGVPVHLVAISWGTKLAVASLALYPDVADSLTLLGPALVSKADVSFALKLRTALALVIDPRKRFDIPLADPRLFTDNPERVEFIRNDPLSLRTCTARFLYQTSRLDRFVRRYAEELRAPVLMMLAGRDRIVDNDGTRKVFERFASRPKEVILYEQAAHTLEFERDPKPVFEDMVRWLDARSG